MFTKGLSSKTQSNLESLTSLPFVKNYYLADGTALALHFGHRFSHDLDFFSQNPNSSEIIRDSLEETGKLEIIQNDYGTFNGILNGVKISFFIYKYPLLYPIKVYKGIKIADILDIACMKLDAVSSRGTKRDFIDLFFICQKTSLSKILSLYLQKYAMAKVNKLHIIKSLVYFTDAEGDPVPQMIEKIDWEKIEAFFEKEAVRLGKKYL